MNELCKTELLNLLKDNSQTVANQEMQLAYENFMKVVLTMNQSETDYQTAFRLLNLTRIELQSLQIQISYEQGEKCA